MSESEKKILIIDDDISALDIVDYLFEDSGYSVERSVDGESAVESVAEIAPSVILVDLMMPKMNGQETVRQIRSQSIKVPIVAFTALDDPEVHQEAMDAGCDLVLTKPCRPKVLLQHIEKLLAS